MMGRPAGIMAGLPSRCAKSQTATFCRTLRNIAQSCKPSIADGEAEDSKATLGLPLDGLFFSLRRSEGGGRRAPDRYSSVWTGGAEEAARGPGVATFAAAGGCRAGCAGWLTEACCAGGTCVCLTRRAAGSERRKPQLCAIEGPATKPTAAPATAPTGPRTTAPASAPRAASPPRCSSAIAWEDIRDSVAAASTMIFFMRKPPRYAGQGQPGLRQQDSSNGRIRGLGASPAERLPVSSLA